MQLVSTNDLLLWELYDTRSAHSVQTLDARSGTAGSTYRHVQRFVLLGQTAFLSDTFCLYKENLKAK
jgi:hypothetical protein